MEEVFKDIKGYEGLYQVSNLGRIKKLNYNNTGKEIIMKPQPAKGYLQLMLHKNCVSKHIYIHRAVAEAFIPNPDNLPQVNHKDENKANNNVDNLEWCTPKYNINYGTGHKRSTLNHINHQSLSKKVLCIETNIIYDSTREAERQTGISHSGIARCSLGKRKTAGGFHWKCI